MSVFITEMETIELHDASCSETLNDFSDTDKHEVEDATLLDLVLLLLLIGIHVVVLVAWP